MSIRHAAILVLGVVMAGCVAASATPAVQAPVAPRGGSIDHELDADANLESMLWSAARPLKLTDFRAPVPPGAEEGARTAYLLSYGMWCRSGVFRFVATTSFLPGHSWVQPRALAEPAEGRRILNHEQTHFNQTEVYARRMRRFFQEQLYDPCGHTEDELNTLADRFVADEAAAQQRYDQDTSFGRTRDRQREWDAKIADELASLDRFAATDRASTTLAP